MQKVPQFLILSPRKLISIDEKYFFKFKIALILINLNQISPMKPLELEISVSFESYDRKLPKIAEISTMLKSAGMYKNFTFPS